MSSEYWDTRYAESHHVWSGRVNDVLGREAANLPPGRALDLGAGEGADAIWLARRGWRVTAADISRVALDKAAAHAAEEGVADRIDWQRHDLNETFPEGAYDLVSAQFLHSPDGLTRDPILRSAAAAVAPGGVLLIGSHAGWPDWVEHQHHDVEFPSPEEILDRLELADGEWDVLMCREHDREQRKPDGTIGIRVDSTVMVRRKALAEAASGH
ncbi:SAM-dependent methyltransferase [Phytomonospora endophytica]|uniref:SAM-dependent methyltransferase n=1 Tax=Phytomonospora endophytica TaxID=714109 RepID=A0A841FTZ8_9ACTN|nr:methyltransferase domain-containing protein [Phytomonospora endophytica]MBB6037022.1 SAM-dependent methyltransferase [Phytomonospora endophytica]GIG69434.1 methyltransferase [Phytomonospora endophytica]